MGRSVSVVIPTIDGGEGLLRCVDAVARQGDVIEVIIVDNGSSGGAVEAVRSRFADVEILRYEENRWYAGGCMNGARVARGDFFLFLNDDAYVSGESVRRLVDAFEQVNGLAVCAPVTVQTSGELDSCGSFLTSTGFLRHGRVADLAGDCPYTDVFSVKGAVMMVDAEVFWRVGGFDESYFAYFEETDLCWRCRIAGFRVVTVNDVRALHDPGSTSSRVFPSHVIDYLAFRNRIVTLVKDLPARDVIRVLGLHLAICAGVSGAFVVRGRWRNSAAVMRAIIWSFANGVRLWKIRRKRVERIGVGVKMDPGLSKRMDVATAVELLRMYLVRW